MDERRLVADALTAADADLRVAVEMARGSILAVQGALCSLVVAMRAEGALSPQRFEQLASVFDEIAGGRWEDDFRKAGALLVLRPLAAVSRGESAEEAIEV